MSISPQYDFNEKTFSLGWQHVIWDMKRILDGVPLGDEEYHQERFALVVHEFEELFKGIKEAVASELEAASSDPPVSLAAHILNGRAHWKLYRQAQWWFAGRRSYCGGESPWTAQETADKIGLALQALRRMEAEHGLQLFAGSKPPEDEGYALLTLMVGELHEYCRIWPSHMPFYHGFEPHSVTCDGWP